MSSDQELPRKVSSKSLPRRNIIPKVPGRLVVHRPTFGQGGVDNRIRRKENSTNSMAGPRSSNTNRVGADQSILKAVPKTILFIAQVFPTKLLAFAPRDLAGSCVYTNGNTSICSSSLVAVGCYLRQRQCSRPDLLTRGRFFCKSVRGDQ